MDSHEIYKNLWKSPDEFPTADKIKIIEDPQNKDVIKDVINRLNDVEETLLMWAVWTADKELVIALLSKGANVKFRNSNGESVSTFWDIYDVNQTKTFTDKEQNHLLDIATILHNAGAELDKPSMYSSSVVKISRDCHLDILYIGLFKLGYR